MSGIPVVSEDPADRDDGLTLTQDDRVRFAQEAMFCERILAKTGDTVLHDTLRGVAVPTVWQHYPDGEVYDPESGGQWYYHSHADEHPDQTHGHFHCFVRPQSRPGPIHHLVAIGVDACGQAVRLFTVNQWVVDDQALDAPQRIRLLPRFDVQMARPSYLVNRWLTAVVALYQDEIAELIRARDACLQAHARATGKDAAQDRQLQVTSALRICLQDRCAALGAGV